MHNVNRQSAIIARLRRLAVWLLAVLLATLSPRLLAGTEESPRRYAFATAQKGTFYHALGQRICRQLNQLQHITTHGSQENVERLTISDGKEGVVSFALAMQDIVSRHLRRLQYKTSQQVNNSDAAAVSFQVVGRVSFDYLHVFVRNPVHVDQVEDFGGMRIWLGRRRSGTRVTATGFLETVGLPQSKYDPVPKSEPPPDERDAEGLQLNFGEPDSLVANRDIDAAVLVAIPGYRREISQEMAKGAVSLFSLDYDVLRLLTRQEPSNLSETGEFYRQTFVDSIPANTYPNQPEPVRTLVIPSLLLVREGVPRALVKQVWETAQIEAEHLKAEHGYTIHQPPQERQRMYSLKEANLPLASGIRTNKRDGNSTLLKEYLAIGCAIVGLLAVLSVSWIKRKQLRVWIHRFTRHRAALSVTIALTGILVITYATHWVEQRAFNENFSTFAESLWSITLYLSSGLENRRPYTQEGRLFAALGLVLGPVLFATITAWMAAGLIEWRRKMPEKLRGHYVLLNWNRRALEAIRQIHHPVITETGQHAVVVVLTDDINVNLKNLKESGSTEGELFEDVYVSVGDPTEEQALLNANAQDAASIIALADDRREEGADERTIRSVFMLRKIARDKGVNNMNVIAELKDLANRPILEEMSHDFPGLLEVLASGETRTYLLAQAALNKGLIGFYKDLLSVSEKTSEVYIHQIPSSAAGMEFHRYASKVMNHCPDTPVIPVGIQRTVNGRTEIYCNPKPESEAFTLHESDQLVILAYQPIRDADLPQG